MKTIFAIITALFVQQAFGQNVYLKITGDLSKGYSLNVIDKSTKKKSSSYKVHDFIIQIKDTNNKDIIGTDGRKVRGLVLQGDTLNRSDFKEACLNVLPPGKYHLIFTTIICIKLKPKYETEGSFSLPDQTVVMIKKE